MKFCVKQRNGTARLGELYIDENKISTPEILFLSTDRFKPPNFANIIITDKKTKFEKPALQISKQFRFQKNISDIILKEKTKQNEYLVLSSNKEILKEKFKENFTSVFIVANASQLLNQPKKFVDFIIELRNKIGYQKAIYLPSIGNPSNIALFIYLGLDLFDSASAINAARNNILFFQNANYKIDDLNEISCSCPACNKLNIKPSKMKFDDILNHNYYALINEIKQIRNVISSGNIRNLVEIRSKADPNLTTILRYLDLNHFEYLEKRTSITSNKKIYATTKESLLRPEIRRFQERVINRYKKPKSAKILLLLPCSSKKPYSFSKSHKFFKEKIKNCKNPDVIHEVIITSPIGIVPRDLELIYPASNYDIPVIGVWDEDEKKMIRSLLSQFLKNNNYKKIISHLPKEMNGFLSDIIKNSINTCKNHPTSDESLDSLLKVLNEITKAFEKKPKNRNFEDISGFASFQFGKNVADILLKDCIIKGKYPYRKIMKNNTQIGMIVFDRGLISLTLNGAERIFNSKKYWIKIFDDFNLVGSVFSPGVKDADPEIRKGDEVVVIQKNKLVAVGVAQMCGEEMKESNHGEAVKVRHIV